MIKVVGYEPFRLSDLKEFCAEVSKDISYPNAQNMSIADWEYSPNTLLYKLLIDRVFEEGELTMIYNSDKEVIAVSGVYRLQGTTFIGGARTWVKQPYRHLWYVGTQFLPRHAEIAKGLGGERMWLTFNEIMKKIPDLIEVANEKAKRGQKSIRPFGTKYPQIYQKMKRLPETRIVNSVPQHVLELDLTL